MVGAAAERHVMVVNSQTNALQCAEKIVFMGFVFLCEWLWAIP